MKSKCINCSHSRTVERYCVSWRSLLIGHWTNKSSMSRKLQCWSEFALNFQFILTHLYLSGSFCPPASTSATQSPCGLLRRDRHCILSELFCLFVAFSIRWRVCLLSSRLSFSNHSWCRQLQHWSNSNHTNWTVAMQCWLSVSTRRRYCVCCWSISRSARPDNLQTMQVQSSQS